MRRLQCGRIERIEFRTLLSLITGVIGQLEVLDCCPDNILLPSCRANCEQLETLPLLSVPNFQSEVRSSHLLPGRAT